MKTRIGPLFPFFILILAASCSSHDTRLLATTTYVTTPTRAVTVTNFCTKTSRLQLYNKYGIDGNLPHGQSVGNFFDMNTTIVQYALDGNWNQVGQQIKNNGGKFFVYYGAWAIGLAITLLIWPFLLCCCICPWKCPLWNRKPQKMPYSKCETIWPAVVTIFLLLTVLVCSIVGIASRFKAQSNYQEFACSTGVVYDDLINGNVSLTNSSVFFSGIKTIYTQLLQLNSQLTELNAEIAKLGTASTGVTNANTQITAGKTATAQVPSTTQSALSLSYNSPIQSSSTSSTISSTFPAILGTSSNSSTLVGSAYLTLTAYQSVVSQISSSADSYITDSPTYVASINQAMNDTNNTVNSLEDSDKTNNNFFQKNENKATGVSVGQYVLYGVLIGLSLIQIIVVIATVWCSRNACRKFMYVICFLMFLLAIVSFVFCLFVSIINPITYYSCVYINQNLASKAKLQSTLVQHLDIDAGVAANISQCIAADGNGDIAQDLLGSSVYNSLTALGSTTSNLSVIDSSYGTYISTLHQYLLDNTTNYMQAKTNDITDQTSLNELIKLSKASSYSCSSSGFSSDSWVPSNQQTTSYVPCQVSTGNSNSSSCTTSSSFNSRAAGCVGCMDTYDLFKGNSTVSNVKAALDSRYSDSSCSTFNTELSNVWGNFYQQKLNTIGPVQTRATAAKSQADIVAGTVSYFTNIQNTINSDFSSIVNVQYGLLAGLDCKTIGQDVRLMRDVFCQGVFLYTYFIRVIFGIISFALLFLLCCVTCVGHRNAKLDDFNRNQGPSGQYDKKYQPQNEMNEQFYANKNGARTGQQLFEMKQSPYQNQQNHGYYHNPNI